MKGVFTKLKLGKLLINCFSFNIHFLLQVDWCGMRPKGLRADRILDGIHKSIVLGCVGLTCFGFYLAGLRVHRYYTVLVPAAEERERLKKLELLAEGQDKKEFLPEPPKADELKY